MTVETGSPPRPTGAFRFPAHYWFFFGALAAASLVSVTAGAEIGVAVMAAFDAAAIAFLAVIALRFGAADADKLRTHVSSYDPARRWAPFLALATTVAVASALVAELARTTRMDSGLLALSLGTLVVAWVFMNTVFALRYAHLFYGRRAAPPPLIFPGDEQRPDIWDFCYFSFVLGMTFQVSDVTIACRRLRRDALVHGLLAFSFNIGVLALSVNLVASAG